MYYICLYTIYNIVMPPHSFDVVLSIISNVCGLRDEHCYIRVHCKLSLKIKAITYVPWSLNTQFFCIDN